MTQDSDVLVLGGGLAGLATASALGDRAIVLEREAEAGGLARSLALGEYWFDHVLHLLYFADPDTERRVRAIVGTDLQPCPPEAWVESMSGRARFPFQAHLRELPPNMIARCLTDLAASTFGPAAPPAANYEEMLLQTFGRAMCEEFFLPYNQKMWKRPLDGLSASGFHWNIQRPDFESVVKGSLPETSAFAAYNARGWYPRPSRGPRGMGVLSRALARSVQDLRFGHEVQSINPTRREVVVRRRGRASRFRYRHALVCTLPLPVTLGLVCGLPRDLTDVPGRLPYNRVLTPCFCVRGPRPEGTGHWRYYADPSLSFTRLVFMHRFDPSSAPRDGWGLMAEITQPGEQPVPERVELLGRVRGEIERLGVLPQGSKIVNCHLEISEYGYVAFEQHVEPLVKRALSVLRRLDIHPVGRYARWEYSSMAQVMRDGFAQGDALLRELEVVSKPALAHAQ